MPLWHGPLVLLHPLLFSQATELSAAWPFSLTDQESHRIATRGSLRRILKRSQEPSQGFQIHECIQVSRETEGIYHYTSDGRQETCGLYLVGRPDQKIKITLEKSYLDDDCDFEAVVLLDGWELNGNILPSDQDHGLPMDNRFLDICGDRSHRKTVLLSSQNNAMVQYKIPTPGNGYSVKVEFIRNTDPCNILMADMTGVFNFTNRKEGSIWQHFAMQLKSCRNCTLTTLLFPARLDLIELNLGKKQCFDCDHDYLEIGGSSQLSSTQLETRVVFGQQSFPTRGHPKRDMSRLGSLVVLCDSTTIRLVSSGQQENRAIVQVKAADEEDLTGGAGEELLMCGE